MFSKAVPIVDFPINHYLSDLEMSDLKKLIKLEQRIGDVAYWLLTVVVIIWPTYTLLS